MTVETTEVKVWEGGTEASAGTAERDGQRDGSGTQLAGAGREDEGEGEDQRRQQREFHDGSMTAGG